MALRCGRRHAAPLPASTYLILKPSTSTCCSMKMAPGADAVVLGDLGCMLNIEGRLRRRGDQNTKVLHVAEVLAGMTDEAV